MVRVMYYGGPNDGKETYEDIDPIEQIELIFGKDPMKEMKFVDGKPTLIIRESVVQICTPSMEHKMLSPIMKYFTTEHLPEYLQKTAAECAQLAMQMEHSLPEGPEKSAGLRKLLEAKDCFVRAALPQ